MEIVVAREEILNHLRQRLYRKVSIADLEVLSLTSKNAQSTDVLRTDLDFCETHVRARLNGRPEKPRQLGEGALECSLFLLRQPL